MLAFAYFLLKVIICSAVLFGYYWFFLRNKVFHAYNRFYLLAIVVLSVTLPLMKINIFHKAAEPKTNIIKMLQVVTVGDEYMDEVIISPKKNSITTAQILPFAYMLVSFVLLIMMLQMLIHIASLLRKNKVMLIEDIHFVNTDNAKGTPFSFFKYIFWNQQIDMQSPAGTRIFKHEVAHIQERHSWDKMFINTILIAFWINPIFWLIRRELSLIHEFIADKKAVEDGDTAAFAAMILAATYPQQRIGITSNFFYSPIKRRLMMLTKNQNPKMNYISRLLVLPLAVVVFAAFTLKAKIISDAQKNNAITNKITSFLTTSNPSAAGTESNEPTTSTVRALFPMERKIRVVLDAGHGGADKGGISKDGTAEKDLTLQLVKKIKSLNKNPNIEIILTREDDIYMNPKEKAAFANEQTPDLFISVHVDNAGPKSDREIGMSVWVAKDSFSNSMASKLFASAIIGRFENNYGLNVIPSPMQRQIGIWVLQATKAPAVVIEAGFISNEKEREYLKSDKGQETFATNILNALNDYVAGKYTLENNSSLSSATGMYAGQIAAANANENVDASERTNANGETIMPHNPFIYANSDPYVVIDGRESSVEVLTKVLKEGVDDVRILKNDEAVKIYGKKALNGAIIVNTKKIKTLPVIEKNEQKTTFIDPVFRVGNLTKSFVLAEDFKKEEALTVTDGYSFVQAQVYFSGAGFPQVQMATINSSSLA